MPTIQFKKWIGKEVGKQSEDAARHDKWRCMMYPRFLFLSLTGEPTCA